MINPVPANRPAPPVAGAAAEWDTALRAWPRAHLLQTHGWGEVQAAAGWQPHLLRVEVGGRLLPVLALAGDAVLPGLPPRLWVPKGPACGADDTDAWQAAAAALTELAASLGAASVEIEPNAWEAEADALLRALGGPWRRGLGREPASTAVVDLRGGWEAVLAGMRPQGRRNVRLAERRGVDVGDLDGDAAVATLARMASETASRQGIALPGAAHYRRVLAAVPSARVHVARVEGEVVAAVLAAAFAAEAIYLYGGSTLQHRERQPSAAVHAHVMRGAIASGCERYDLWGIPPDADPLHPWHGLRQFKLALGGVEMKTAGAAIWTRRPVLVRAIEVATAARAGVRRARRRLRVERRVGRQDFA